MPSSAPSVLSVNISAGGIPKTPVDRCEVLEEGLAGDGRDHDKHEQLHRAVSLVDLEILRDLCAEGFDVSPGAIGENLTVSDLHVQEMDPGVRLAFSGGVEIELTESRNPCFVLDAIDPALKKEIVGRCGFLAKVITAGTITPGEIIATREPGT